MCGFLGWFKRGQEAWDDASRAAQARALECIRHRGPDDGSEESGAGWWMGFRRLSILDLSNAARQPMRFSGGSFVLTFNGEIYNFRELRHQFCSAREFHSTGDSEVLGAMLETLPATNALESLRGMFAFAWWDTEKRELMAARDHFGIKPLYYRIGPDGDLWIGSELKALKLISGHSGAITRPALAAYFRWGAIHAPDTILEDVQCLPPGHLLRWKDGEMNIERWFTPRFPGQEAWVQGETAQRELVRETVLRSIDAHLVADVPVGVFLSGGLDSTIMAASMRHLGQQEVQAFSIGYEAGVGIPDESDAAARTAKHLGCKFVSERLQAESLESRLDAYFSYLDQPTGDALNTYLVSRLASEHVKVTLSGLGADEWFAGYNYHRLALLASQSPVARSALGKVTGALVRGVDGLLSEGLRGHRAWKALCYAAGSYGANPLEWQRRSRAQMEPGKMALLLGISEAQARDWSRDAVARSVPDEDIRGRAPDSWLHQVLLLETETYLANTLLRDNDCTSMAHSLELRVPLVDREVWALAGRLPPECKLSLGGGKRVLREAFRDLLPPWIYDDRQKKTFTLPLMAWMKHPKWRDRIHDVLLSQRCKERGWMQPGVVGQMMDRYYNASASGRALWPACHAVWKLFVLESWARTHLD